MSSIDNLLTELHTIAVIANYHEYGLPSKNGTYSEDYKQMVEAVELFIVERDKTLAQQRLMQSLYYGSNEDL